MPMWPPFTCCICRELTPLGHLRAYEYGYAVRQDIYAPDGQILLPGDSLTVQVRPAAVYFTVHDCVTQRSADNDYCRQPLPALVAHTVTGHPCTRLHIAVLSSCEYNPVLAKPVIIVVGPRSERPQ
jgi:hypothetical protein